MTAPTGPWIALVDDEETLRETVGFALRREGFRVTPFPDGHEAWQELQRSLPDLAILDVLMPRMDGRELCRRLRALSERLPILFLTSRDDEFDRVLGLELGADDYLCKPFSMRELVARVKVLLRRAALSASPPLGSSGVSGAVGEDERILELGRLRLDLRRYRATWSGERSREASIPGSGGAARDPVQQPVHEPIQNPIEIPLTVTEFTLLHALVRHPGHVKSRAQLLEEGYPHDAYVSDRTIDSHIKRLRKKLAEAAPQEELIETVYGLGYRFRER